MYTGFGGGGALVAGIAVLPNTGDNHILMITSIVSIVAGSVILTTSIVRAIAKKAYKA